MSAEASGSCQYISAALSPRTQSLPVSPTADGRSRVVDHRDGVAGDGFADCSGADPTRPVGDEDVIRLGRSDAVEHLDPEGVVPALVERFGQGLAGGGAQPQAAQIMSGGVGVIEHRLHHRGYVDEDGGPVARDQLEDQIGRGPVRKDDAAGANAEGEQGREVAGIAEEQLRHREDHVLGTDAQHASRVCVIAEQRAPRRVHARLGLTGATGGELPERDVVGTRGRGIEAGRLARDQ